MTLAETLGHLLGQDNVAAIDSVEPSLAAPWAHAAPGWVFFGCLALGALAITFYLRYQPPSHRKARLALGVIRAALLCLMLIALADPVLTFKFVHRPKPLLWVLFDGTDSMAIQDEMPDSDRARLAEAVGLPASGSPEGPKQTKLTRADYVRAWAAKKDDNVLSKLSEKFRLQAFIFDRPDGVRSLPSSGADNAFDPASLTEHLTTSGQVTALGKAFEDLSLRHATSNLAGVVVVSDFDQNSGPHPQDKANNLHVPIYTIGVGPKSALDLSVEVGVPPVMKKAERSMVLVNLHQSGLEGETANVTLTAKRLANAGETGAAAESVLVGQRSVELKSSTQQVEFPYTPEETGRFEFTADVTPLPGEVVDQNNRATRESTIRDDFLRLMYVEYEPTWEWRFIKEVFHRDKLVGMRGFRTFLRSSDPKVRISNELFLPTLTPQRSEFFANDVIFLGDMPAATLSPRFCEMTKEFVRNFGGGLVVIAGPRFGPGQLASTPLADMLPVVVDPDGKPREREFTLRLSPDAANEDFMQLGGDAAENRKAWDNLGTLPWYQPVSRPHPDGGFVLAQHPTDMCIDGKTPQPIIAVRRFGKGQVVYLGFDETWRLRRRYGELYYRQFWGQMIHRLGLSHALGAQKRFVVSTDRQQYQADDKVILRAEAYDANYEPLSDEKLADKKISGELVAPEQPGARLEPQPITLTQSREGVFEARLPVSYGGEYRVRVKDPVTGEMSETAFEVTRLSAERRSAVRNVGLQNEIAQATGGRSFDLISAARLPDEVKMDAKAETSIRVFPLTSTWLCFSVVICLMLGEWLVRKLINLP